MQRLAIILAAVVFAASSEAGRAAGSPGLYIGAAVGQARVEAQGSGALASAPYDIDQRRTGWKALLGLRPLSFLGAEMEYADFGHVTHNLSNLFLRAGADVRQKETGAFVLAYLPLPLPWLNLYGKIGGARTQTVYHSSFARVCPPGYPCPLIVVPSASVYYDRMDTELAYGPGIQVKRGAWAIRAEYERFSAAGAHPALLSLGATFSFL